MTTDASLQVFYEEAYGFLLKRMGEEILHKQLNPPNTPQPKNIRDVFRCLLGPLADTKKMKAGIADIGTVADLLFGFDPVRTHSCYRGECTLLYDKVRNVFQPHCPADMDNPRDCWVLFCEGALTGASFLRELKTLKAFKAFVQGFQYSDMTLPALPLLLTYEIHGYTFPMACRFLAACGYADYVTPDTCVKKVLLDSGLIESMDNYETFNTLIRIARVNQKSPAAVHKVLWLIGTGCTGEDGVKDTKLHQQFIEHTRPILHSHH